MNENGIRRAMRDSLCVVANLMQTTAVDEDLFAIINAMCIILSDRIIKQNESEKK